MFVMRLAKSTLYFLSHWDKFYLNLTAFIDFNSKKLFIFLSLYSYLELSTKFSALFSIHIIYILFI